MKPELPPVPPGRVWIPVWDLPSALEALEILIELVTYFTGSAEHQDHDEL